MKYGGRTLLALLALAAGPVAHAQSQSWVPGDGHGSMSVSYQDLYISTHTTSNGDKAFPGDIDNRTVFLNFDYGLTDRLAVSIGLPFRSNRFRGPGGHDPGSLDDDHGQKFHDDGQFHSGWQNWNLTLRYLWRDSAVKVVPFVSFGYPSHGYPTFAHAALGTGQRHLQLGATVLRQFNPPLQDLYLQAGYAYTIMQKVEDRQVNRSTFNLELGYFATPRLAFSLLVTAQKTHNGFDFPDDYPNRHDDHFFYHDMNLRNDFVNVAAAANFQLNDRHALFASYGYTVWGENAHMLDHVITLGISRSF